MSSLHRNGDQNQAPNQPSSTDSNQKVGESESRPVSNGHVGKSRVRKIQCVRGFLNKCSSSGTWRRRWFVLSKRGLSYFKTKGDTKQKGSLKVGGCKVFLEEDESSNAQFSVISSSGSSFLLHARNSLEARQWCIVLETASRSHPAADQSASSCPAEPKDPSASTDISHLPLLLVLELVEGPLAGERFEIGSDGVTVCRNPKGLSATHFKSVPT
jgi:hypothetical protein